MYLVIFLLYPGHFGILWDPVSFKNPFYNSNFVDICYLWLTQYSNTSHSGGHWFQPEFSSKACDLWIWLGMQHWRASLRLMLELSSQSLPWFFRCIQHTHSFGRSPGLMLIYSLLYFAGFSPHFLDSVAIFHNYCAQRVEILFCVVQSFFVGQCCRIALGCRAERKVKYKK